MGPQCPFPLPSVTEHKQTYFGQEIDADRGLVLIIERIVHEACYERGLSDCAPKRYTLEMIEARMYVWKGCSIPLCSPRKTNLDSKVSQTAGA